MTPYLVLSVITGTIILLTVISFLLEIHTKFRLSNGLTVTLMVLSSLSLLLLPYTLFHYIGGRSVKNDLIDQGYRVTRFDRNPATADIIIGDNTYRCEVKLVNDRWSIVSKKDCVPESTQEKVDTVSPREWSK